VDHEIPSRHGGPGQNPIVEFTTDGGAKVRLVQSENERGKRIAVGTELAVVYDPRNPANAELAPLSWTFVGTAGGFGLLLLVAGVGASWLVGGFDRRAASAQVAYERVAARLPWRSRDRVTVAGTIRTVKPAGDGDPRSIVVCTSQRPDEEVDRDFESEPVTLERGVAYEGRPVLVYFNPEDPRMHWVDLEPALAEIREEPER
jgi:hypothetical protein